MNMLANFFWWFSGVFCGYRWQKLELPDSKFGTGEIICPYSFTYVYLDQILCLKNMPIVPNLQLVFNPFTGDFFLVLT